MAYILLRMSLNRTSLRIARVLACTHTVQQNQLCVCVRACCKNFYRQHAPTYNIRAISIIIGPQQRTLCRETRYTNIYTIFLKVDIYILYPKEYIFFLCRNILIISMTKNNVCVSNCELPIRLSHLN